MDKKTIKIALVSLQQDAERVPPVGLIYIATYLKEKLGIEKNNIKIFDKNFDDNIENKVKEFNPDILGLSAMTVQYTEVINFSKKIKLYNRKTKIILGGVHISSLPESLDKCFDLAVIGEGELTFLELIKLYLKKEKFSKPDLKKIKSIIFWDNEKLIQTPIRLPIDLDILPFPDFSFVSRRYFEAEEIPGIASTGIKTYIITSRGCPYRCVFCSTSRFWKNVRFHSAEYVARLVKKAIDEYNANFIKVMDDLFTVSVSRLLEIKKEFDKLRILEKIKGVECQPRANLINDEMCEAMKQLKIKTINFGFESGSEKVLKYLKQGSVTVQDNKKAILLCKKYGFKVYGSLMFGSPGETINDMEKTLDFIDFATKNKADYIWSFISTPFPDTPFWDIALKKGKVSNNMNFSVLAHHNIDNPMLLDDNIDKKEFKKIFLRGRKKLRKLKIRLIKNFIFKNPGKALRLVSKEPKYYIARLFKQLYKQ